MPYLIPFIIGIDIRWVHIAAVMGIAILFGIFIMGALKTRLNQGQTISLVALSGLPSHGTMNTSHHSF